jgi:thymidylate synthase
MNELDKQYLALLQDILDNGIKKNTRNGEVLSVFGRSIRYKFKDGKFPLLTTKKMAWKTMVTELLWFLRGDTNIKFLVDNGCHIWDGDAYKNYINKTNEYKGDWPDTMDEFINKIKTDDEFAKKWGNLGKIYGSQWKSWGKKNVINYDLENVKSSDKVKVMDLIRDGGDYSKYDVKVTYQNNSIDQIQNLINDLKTNPDSRRLMVTAWNPADLEASVLPPCHYGFQVYTRELTDGEIINYFYTHINPTTKWKKIDNSYFYYVEEYDMWCEHSGSDILWGMRPVCPKRAISLMYNCRSQDVPLGTPFNLASYGLLLTILAKEVNMVPDELISNMGDCHIYLNQIDGVKEQLTREPFELPTLNQFPTYEGTRPSIESYVIGDFTLKNYQSHPTIKMPLSN